MRKLGSCWHLLEAKRGDTPHGDGQHVGAPVEVGPRGPEEAGLGITYGYKARRPGRGWGATGRQGALRKPLGWWHSLSVGRRVQRHPAPGGWEMQADRCVRSRAEPRGLGEGLCVCASQEPLSCRPLPATSQSSSPLDVWGPLSEWPLSGWPGHPSCPLLPACGPGRDCAPLPQPLITALGRHCAKHRGGPEPVPRPTSSSAPPDPYPRGPD